MEKCLVHAPQPPTPVEVMIDSCGEKHDDIEEPDALLCPVTQVMFREPSFVPESGNTYERSAIQRYWSMKPPARDALTNVQLMSKALHPNWGKRREVQAFLDAHEGYVPQGWPDRKVPSAISEPIPSFEAMSRGGRFAQYRHHHHLHHQRVYFRTMCLVAPLMAAVGVISICRNLATEAIASEPSRVSAHEVHGALRGAALPLSWECLHNATALQPPKGSKLIASMKDDHLVVRLPPSGLNVNVLFLLGFAIMWLSLLCVWTTAAISIGSQVFALFSFPFWCVGGLLLVTTIKMAFLSETLDISGECYVITKLILGRRCWEERGELTELSSLPSHLCSGHMCCILFESGVFKHSFGSGFNLQNLEAKWLQQLIRQHISDLGCNVPTY